MLHKNGNGLITKRKKKNTMGWIDANKEQPKLLDGCDYSDNVLAVANGQLMVMSYGYLHGDAGGFMWANCNGDIHGEAEYDDDYTVTHWMPLPKLPDVK